MLLTHLSQVFIHTQTILFHGKYIKYWGVLSCWSDVTDLYTQNWLLKCDEHNKGNMQLQKDIDSIVEKTEKIKKINHFDLVWTCARPLRIPWESFVAIKQSLYGFASGCTLCKVWYSCLGTHLVPTLKIRVEVFY